MLILYGLFVAARTKINHQCSCFFQYERRDGGLIVKVRYAEETFSLGVSKNSSKDALFSHVSFVLNYSRIVANVPDVQMNSR